MKIFTKIAVVLLATLGFSGLASAGCIEENSCFNDVDMFMSSAQTSTFGFGGSVGLGDEVGNEVTESGDNETMINMTYEGDGCEPDCGRFQVEMESDASHRVTTDGWAKGSTPGQAAEILGQSQTGVETVFVIGKSLD